MSLSRSLAAAMALLAASVGAGAATPSGEHLLQPRPDGYKVAMSEEQGKLLTTEMIPATEDLDGWTEMVTVQVFRGGLPGTTPRTMHAELETLWRQSCPGAIGELVRSGEENGYPFAFWIFSCPLNPQTGKQETTYHKAIQGKDGFYLVQKAWKREPTKDEVVTWSRFLAGIRLCDNRIAGRACPAAKPQPAQQAEARPAVAPKAEARPAPAAKKSDEAPKTPDEAPKPRPAGGSGDMRNCLDLPTNAEVMRCAAGRR